MNIKSITYLFTSLIAINSFTLSLYTMELVRPAQKTKLKSGAASSSDAVASAYQPLPSAPADVAEGVPCIRAASIPQVAIASPIAYPLLDNPSHSDVAILTEELGALRIRPEGQGDLKESMLEALADPVLLVVKTMQKEALQEAREKDQKEMEESRALEQKKSEQVRALYTAIQEANVSGVLALLDAGVIYNESYKKTIDNFAKGQSPAWLAFEYALKKPSDKDLENVCKILAQFIKGRCRPFAGKEESLSNFTHLDEESQKFIKYCMIIRLLLNVGNFSLKRSTDTPIIGFDTKFELHMAAEVGHRALLFWLLKITSGVYINTTHFSRSAASYAPDIATAKLLVELGLTIIDSSKTTYKNSDVKAYMESVNLISHDDNCCTIL